MKSRKFLFTFREKRIIIEHVSEILFTAAIFPYVIWPLVVLTGFFYSIPGRGGLRAIARRIGETIPVVWGILFFPWLLSWWSTAPVQTIIPAEPLNTALFLGGFALFTVLPLLRKLAPKRKPMQPLEELARVLNARANLHHADRLTELKRMEPYEFEALVAEVYRALGYSARTVGQSGDHGVDVLVDTPSGERWIVQVKRYRDTVGEGTVRELYGTLHHERASKAVLVTTADITLPAETWARGKPIELVDGPTLLRMMDQARRRTEPNILDRMAAALRAWFNPTQAPSGVRPNGNGVVRAPVIHYTNNRPICPRCGRPMALLPHRPTDRPGRILYRCRNYPACRVTLEGR